MGVMVLYTMGSIQMKSLWLEIEATPMRLDLCSFIGSNAFGRTCFNKLSMSLVLFLIPFIKAAFSEPNSYFVSINGTNSNTCHELSPCAFTKIIKIAKKRDTVYFVDSLYEGKKQLTEFRKTVNLLLNHSVGIIGNNTLINGSEYRQNFDYFIMAHRVQSAVIKNFTFMYFRSPILLLNGPDNASLCNLIFSNNYLDNSYSMVCFTIAQILFNNIQFYENTVNCSTVLMVGTATLLGDHFIFERNYGLQSSFEPLITIINSASVMNDLQIRDNAASDGPLIYTTARGMMYSKNMIIERNAHPEILLNDGAANYSMESAMISDNMGILFEGDVESFIHFDNVTLVNNFAPNEPLFYMPSGVFSMNNQTTICGNHGKHFLMMEEVNSSLVLDSVSISENSFDEAMFQLGKTGFVILYEVSLLDTFSKVALINAKNTDISIGYVNYTILTYPLAINENATIYLSNSTFIEPLENTIIGNDIKYENSSVLDLFYEPKTPSMHRAVQHYIYFRGSFNFTSMYDEYTQMFREGKNITFDENAEKMKDIFNDPTSYDRNTLQKIVKK